MNPFPAQGEIDRSKEGRAASSGMTQRSEENVSAPDALASPSCSPPRQKFL
jgi:hypothetical protein